MKRKRDRKRHRHNIVPDQADPSSAQPDSSTAEAGKAKFLAARQLGASVSEAARWAGVPRATLYRWRRRDHDFAEAWDGSHDKVAQTLEFEAYRRAIKGNDRLLVFLLKSYIPYTFNEKRQAKTLDQEEKDAKWAEFLQGVYAKIAQENSPKDQEDFSQGNEDPEDAFYEDSEDTRDEGEEDTRDEYADAPSLAVPHQADSLGNGQLSGPLPEPPLSHRRPSIHI